MLKSKIIAISGISASFIAIILTIGATIDLFDLLAIILASVFVILPLYYNSIKGCFLCYLAGGVVGFLLTLGIGRITSIVFPAYFIFFGIYPIIRFIAQKKNFNYFLFKFLSLIWFVASGYFFYYYYIWFTGALSLEGIPNFIVNNLLIFIGVFCIVFYFIYDRFVYVSRIIEDRYLKRIIK